MSRSAVPFPPINKNLAQAAIRPNLVDYAAVRAGFDWADARARLDGLPGGRGLNIAYEAVDRHAAGPRAERIALRWLGKDGERRDFTYRDACRRDQPLRQSPGRPRRRPRATASSSCSGGCPSSTSPMLGALKAKCVVSPLFSAFGPEPIATRLEIGEGEVLVTTEALYRRKVEALRARLGKPGACHPDRRRPAARRHAALERDDGRRRRRVRHPADRARGHGAAAFHQRHDRPPEGRDPRARGGRDPSRHRALRARPARQTTSSGAPPIPAG